MINYYDVRNGEEIVLENVTISDVQKEFNLPHYTSEKTKDIIERELGLSLVKRPIDQSPKLWIERVMNGYYEYTSNVGVSGTIMGSGRLWATDDGVIHETLSAAKKHVLDTLQATNNNVTICP